MLDYTLSTEQLAELRAAQRRTRDQREADRIKAVVSLAGGWEAEQVAEVLLIDSNTVRDHFRRYQQGGLPGLLHMAYQGSDCALTDTDLVALDVHVQAHMYLTAKDVAAWVDKEFGVTYTTSGMTALLYRSVSSTRSPNSRPARLTRGPRRRFSPSTKSSSKTKGNTTSSASWTRSTHSTTRCSGMAGSSLARTIR